MKKKAMSMIAKVSIIVAVVAIIAIIIFVPFPVSQVPENGGSQEPAGNETISAGNGTGTAGNNASTYNNTESIESCTYAEPEISEQASFSWHNLTFNTKTKDNTTTYSTTLKFEERNGLQSIVTYISLRKNPLAIENVSAGITKMPLNNTYVSYDNSAIQCDETMLAAAELSYFLGLMGLDVKQASTSSSDLSHPDPERVKTCADANENTTVIVLQSKACRPEIKEEGNCMVIDGGKCKTLSAVERAILNLVEVGISEGAIKQA